MNIGLLLAAAIAAAPSPAPSASPSPGPALQSIGTVTVVSGSPQSLHHAPQAASVIDARSLRAGTAPSIDAALRAVPGVDRDRSNSPFTNYGQLRLSFSGAGNDRGELFVDGVPAQDGFGGQVDWNALPSASIVRGELLRGPGSALYGSGAIGGVLSLLTTAPSRTSGGELDAATGGITPGDATFTETGAVGPFASALTLSSRRLSYGVIPPGQTTAVDRPAISTADVAHLRLRASGEHSSLDLDELVSDDAQQDGRPNDGFSRAFRQSAATWTTGTTTTLALTAFGRATTVVNLADMTASPGTRLYTQHIPSSDAGLRARVDSPAGDGSWSLVAEDRLVTGHSVQNSPTNAVQSDVAGTQRLQGFAVQRTFDGRFGAIVGVRYDAIATRAILSRDDAALSPRLDLRYDLSRAATVRAAFGTGLRAPFLNELIRNFRVGSLLENSNPALVPERSRSAQLGFDVVSTLSRFAVDYTGTRVADAIGFKTIATNVQERFNFGRTATDAFTAEYERGNSCARLRGFATSQHDRVVSPGPQLGKRLAYVPDAAASVEAERTIHAVTGVLELAYSGPTFSDDLERQPLGSALLLGARLTLHGGDGSALSLAIDNIADQRYLTSVDRLGPPAAVTLRLAVPIGKRVTSGSRPSDCG